MNDSDSKVKRVSISLSNDIYTSLDRITEQRGFKSRSQAISEMVAQNAMVCAHELGDEVVAGTITLVYDESRPGLLGKISEIERIHIDEVISTQHVLLEDNHVLEVILVQGAAKQLTKIKDKVASCKGVKSCHLTLSTQILPPIHRRTQIS